jgi:hypothetical protein
VPRILDGAAQVVGGLVAGPLLLGAVLVDGATRAGYDPYRHGVSQLVLGDRGWVARVAFITCGLLVGAFAFTTRRCVTGGPGATWGPRLLGAAALGLVVAGVAPTDPALGYPPGEAEGMTAVGAVHQVGGALLFVGLIGAQVVWARRFAHEGRPGWAICSVVSAVLVGVTATAAGVVYRLVQRGVLATGPVGLLELVSFAVGFTWVCVLAGHLRRRVALAHSESDLRP